MITVELKRRIEPQPKLPIVSLFHSTTEDYEDYYGWCYQHPETDSDMPGLTYNAPYTFDDLNQPGRAGDAYKGGIIERVRVRVEDGVAYWVVNVTCGHEWEEVFDDGDEVKVRCKKCGKSEWVEVPQ